MIKILANDGIDAEGKAMLEAAGYQVDTNKIPQEELPAKLNAYDVIIVRSATKVRKDLIDACPNLKIIARAGVGLDNIDTDYAKSKGITVVNTPAASSQSVAELVFAHLFSLARGLHDANRKMPNLESGEQFKKLKDAYSNGIQLRGKTIGVVGFGRIGQETARIALGLGMEVIPVDLMISEATIDVEVPGSAASIISAKLHSAKWEEMLQRADFISLHVPFSGGKALIGEEEIAKMKDGVILINTARGGAIDELALLNGLSSGKVAGAGLDVFDDEPTPRKEILTHPAISLSPHIGASTVEAQAKIGLELADRILSFFGDK
jgi:D-3-phosphoglycerate dehydrogenase